MPSTKKSNEINTLVGCDPTGNDVGIFGDANAFAANLTASLIFNMAIEELIKDEGEIRLALSALSENEILLKAPLDARLLEIEAKWVLAMALFENPAFI